MRALHQRSIYISRRRSTWQVLISLLILFGLPCAVYAAWNSPSPIVVDAGGGGGPEITSLKIVNGNPAIAYVDYLGTNMKYVRATNVDGTLWGVPITLGTGPVVSFSDVSMAVVHGNPAISYFDNNTSELRYMRAADVNGTAWGAPLIVDTDWQVGPYSSLAVVNGNPAISYFDISNNNLKYVRALDADGSSWGTPLVIDGLSGNVGQYTSLVIVSGNPAISYYDYWPGQDLRYVRANDVNGDSWGTPVIVDSNGDVGRYASMTVVNGHPAIGYRDGSNNDLKYVWANDANGSTWNLPITLDSVGNVGGFLSLAVIDGRPAISYNDFDNGDLRYIRANDANGSIWGTVVTVDSPSRVGWYTSLAVVNGNPAISYCDVLDRHLKYVRANNPTMVTLEKLAARPGLDQAVSGLVAIGLAAATGVGLLLVYRRHPH